MFGFANSTRQTLIDLDAHRAQEGWVPVEFGEVRYLPFGNRNVAYRTSQQALPDAPVRIFIAGFKASKTYTIEDCTAIDVDRLSPDIYDEIRDLVRQHYGPIADDDIYFW